MAVTRIGTIIIDIAFDLRPNGVFSNRPVTLGEPRISLCRGLTHTRHVENIAGATERILPRKVLDKVRLSIVARDIIIGADRFFATAPQPISPLIRLRRRILDAIVPALEAGGAGSTCDEPWFRSQPIFVPEFMREPFAAFDAEISSVCIYELSPSGSRAERALWRLEK